MRILTIRFKNLNSLAGEWRIDLTHPAYVSDGIFAITGPTGAGKSTILDAICLALYAQTPRLGKITKSGNDILSRRTADCFAEVVFETGNGRYRCQWSQRRAHGRVNGELQAARHEISDADSGEILSSKVSEVPDLVTARTGMGFEQFTRAMLLAQGGFAAFLQSGAGERAPILEQITGTAIYSEISRLTYQRHAEEKQKLGLLQAELSGLTLLGDDELAALETTLAAQRQQAEGLAVETRTLREALAWRETLATLERTLVETCQQQKALAVEVEAFTPAQARLALAQKALELTADHAVLDGLRREQERDSQQQQRWRQELPEKEERVKAAAAQWAAAEQARDAAQQQLTALKPVLKTVRALDVQQRGARQNLEAARVELNRLQSEQGKHQDALTRIRSELALATETQLRLDTWLADHAADAELERRLPVLETEWRQLAEAERGLAELNRSLQQQRQVLPEREIQRARCVEAVTAAEARRLEVQAGLDKVQADREARLEGREQEDWRECLLERHARQNRLDGLQKDRQRLHQSQREGEVLAAEQTGHEKTLADWQQQRPVVQTRVDALTTQRGLLETQLELLARIHGLEEQRQHLRDGEPCPLCGSEEHPWARGNVPAANESRESLARVRREESEALKQRADGDSRQDVARDALERLAVKQARWQTEFSALQTQVQADLAALSLADEGEVILAEVERVKAEIARVSERLTALDRLQQALMRGEEALRTAVAKAEAAARQLVTAEAEWMEIQRDTERQQRDVASQQEAASLQRARLLGLLAECGRGEECLGRPAETLENLRQQNEAFLRNLNDRQRLTQQRAVLAESLKHGDITLTNLLAQNRDAAAKQQRQQAEAEALLQQRRDLFGDRDADQAETQATQALQEADSRHRAAGLAHQQAEQAVRDLHTRLGELDAILQQREPALAAADATFRQRLSAAGLADESAYREACLPETERRALATRADDLNRRQLQLDSRRRETEARRQTEQARALTDHQPDELNAALTAATDRLTALQQAIGAVQQQLRDNADLRQSRQSLVDAIAARQRDVARWGRLNDLIGAADGKKFRNFAQGLTFDILIHHANRQLQKLSDRYLLVRDDSQPLELNVMDNYQAGEIRPTRNLSGGESFLVSLALALGLSHMASRNVRVDSLFLDEGFGTLDEDALDTALSALSGLQQSGKLVGVISHVAQLKERIGTQIRVEPGAGGRSRVEGPGCSGG